MIKDKLHLQDIRTSFVLVRGFSRYVLRYWRLELLILLSGNLAVLLSLAIPYLGKLIVDKGILNKDISSLIGLNLLAAIIIAISIFLSISYDYLKNYACLKVEKDLTRDVFNKLKKSRLNFLQQVPGAVNLFRITNDITSASHIINSTLVNFINALLKIIFVTAIIFFINPFLLLVILFSQLLVIFKMKLLLKPLENIKRLSLERGENIYCQLDDLFSHVYLLKAFGIMSRQALKYIHSLFQDLRLRLKLARLNAVSDLIGQTTDKFFFGIIAFFASLLVIKGKLTLGSMAAALLYITQGVSAYSALTEMVGQLVVNKISLERLANLLQEPGLGEGHLGGKLTPAELRRIEFRDISFGYLPDKDVLENISFTIEPGTHIGLVGPSGCGKTTILNLLLGLYPPKKGKIFLNNNDLADMDQIYLLSRIGVVLQEPFLFNDTIANNIAFGLRQSAARDIIYVAQLVGIADFINSLARGLDTVVGDNAYTLSQGQKQRIAIARALIRKPEVLILDEAMSSLDSESEEKIIKAIREKFGYSTIIIVSHRLSAVKSLEKILYFEGGKILHMGRHNELLEKVPSYSEFFKIQLEDKQVNRISLG